MKTLAARRLISLLFISVLLVQVRTAQACDACSSNMGSFYPGFADLGSSFISATTTVRTYGVYIPAGYRYMMSLANGNGHQHPKFDHSAYYDQTHIFNDVRFTYALDKVTFTGVLPVVQKRLFRSGKLIENNVGLGDVRVSILYQALNRTSERGLVKNRLFAGAGFTIPTGESEKPGYDGSIEPSRQTGLGTFSFLLHTAYQLNVKKFGVSVQSAFQTADANSSGYRFGNAFSLSARAYYEVKVSKLIITPSVGMHFEAAGEDKVNGGNYFLDTGGKRVWTPAGLDVFYKSFGASFTWYLPVYEQLNGLQFESKQYFTAGVRYVFKKT